MAIDFKTEQAKLLNSHLKETDSELNILIQKETERQNESIDLIASENFTSISVLEALGTPLCNKYSEGYPGKRYYAGNEYIDQIETLCQKRAIEAFGLQSSDWGVNVQSLSGSPANLEVYQAVMKPGDRLMGLYLPDGGHLSHGYETEAKKISAVATYFESIPFRVDLVTGIIDYDALEENAIKYKPKVIIAGPSAYCRLLDYKRLKEITKKCGAYLVVDMAHISGLIAANVIPSPFPYADIVTTTTHKTLRGPRGAMIFFRRDVDNLEERINFSVFPGHQGGPHNHTIAALATALKQAKSVAFADYQSQILKNAKTLELSLKEHGYNLVSGGTDTHMILLSLRDRKVNGARVEYICEKMGLILNKNSIPGDKSALSPGGVRIGAPAMTSRGMMVEQFETIALFIDKAIQIAESIQQTLPVDSHKLHDFKEYIDIHPDLYQEYKRNVTDLAKQFPMPS